MIVTIPLYALYEISVLVAVRVAPAPDPDLTDDEE
jgi:Sec-independent protein secretion pathway component TatC